MTIDYFLDANGNVIHYNPQTIITTVSNEFVPKMTQDPTIKLNHEVPRDAQSFYEDFGLFPHPRLKDPNTKLPVPVKSLTEYQKRFWNERHDLAVPKSNKVGLTTISGLELFQSRILPEEAGFDALWVAQTQKMANEHLLNLKLRIRNSAEYSKFLILRPDLELFKEEKSKASMIYISNPYDYKRPSRIIAIGASEAGAFSWERVNRVHGSDIALIKSKDQKAFFAGLYSRLANTEGRVKFESIPNGQQGEFWNIVNRARYHIKTDEGDDEYDDVINDFKVFDIPYTEATSAGVISEEFIEKQRRRLGDLVFSQTYECNFLPPGNQWYKPGWMKVEPYTVGF